MHILVCHYTGAPELPRNFQIETLTSREVALSWIAEFDGGDKQNFTLNFKDVKNEKWNSIHIPTIDTRKGNKIHYTLTGLLPQTLYNVNLVAGNKYGTTGNSTLHVQTEGINILDVYENFLYVYEEIDIGRGCTKKTP